MENLKKEYYDLFSRSVALLTIAIWATTLAYFSNFIVTISF